MDNKGNVVNFWLTLSFKTSYHIISNLIVSYFFKFFKFQFPTFVRLQFEGQDEVKDAVY